MKSANNLTKNKTFTFKYDPAATPHRMFANMWEAVDTGQKNIQPKNLIISNNLEAIYRCITPSRWEIFIVLSEKKPNNLTELAQLLNKDYANVWKDVRALERLEIIKLKKEGKEIKPIALYDRIVFDLPVKETFSHKATTRTPLFAKSK